MFYVYSGYVNSDNYDNSNGPTYTMKEFGDEEQVLKFKVAFEQDIHEECANIEFRVFKGSELAIIPDEKVISYKLV